MYVPDSLDRKLIALLREDGRAAYAKLAEILGVTRGTVQTRVDRMVQSGLIRSFTIRVREEHGEGDIRAIMMIEVAGRSTAQIIRALRGLPEIRSLHTTNGGWDLVAWVQTGSLGDFDRVLREVRSIDGVLNSETSLLLTTL